MDVDVVWMWKLASYCWYDASLLETESMVFIHLHSMLRYLRSAPPAGAPLVSDVR